LVSFNTVVLLLCRFEITVVQCSVDLPTELSVQISSFMSQVTSFLLVFSDRYVEKKGECAGLGQPDHPFPQEIHSDIVSSSFVSAQLAPARRRRFHRDVRKQ